MHPNVLLQVGSHRWGQGAAGVPACTQDPHPSVGNAMPKRGSRLGRVGASSGGMNPDPPAAVPVPRRQRWWGARR